MEAQRWKLVNRNCIWNFGTFQSKKSESLRNLLVIISFTTYRSLRVTLTHQISILGCCKSGKTGGKCWEGACYAILHFSSSDQRSCANIRLIAQDVNQKVAFGAHPVTCMVSLKSLRFFLALAIPGMIGQDGIYNGWLDRLKRRIISIPYIFRWTLRMVIIFRDGRLRPLNVLESLMLFGSYLQFTVSLVVNANLSSLYEYWYQLKSTSASFLSITCNLQYWSWGIKSANRGSSRIAFR